MRARGPVRAAVWPGAAGAEDPHRGPRAGAPVPRSGRLAGPQRGAVALPAGGRWPVAQRRHALRPLGRGGRLGAAVPGGGGRARPAARAGRRHGGAGARLRGQRAHPPGEQAAAGRGRPRGGFRTTPHVLVAARGTPLTCIVTRGAAGDHPRAIPRLAGQRAREVSADRRDDAAAPLRSIAQERHATATIPPPARRVPPRLGDDAAYQGRHLVACCIGQRKSCRRVCSRCDKDARRSRACVHCASTVIRLTYTRQRHLAHGDARCAWWAVLAPRRALSSRTPTSRWRCATAGRRGRARGSPPGAGRAATGTRVARRSRPFLPARRHVRP